MPSNDAEALPNLNFDVSIKAPPFRVTKCPNGDESVNVVELFGPSAWSNSFWVLVGVNASRKALAAPQSIRATSGDHVPAAPARLTLASASSRRRASVQGGEARSATRALAELLVLSKNSVRAVVSTLASRQRASTTSDIVLRALEKLASGTS